MAFPEGSFVLVTGPAGFILRVGLPGLIGNRCIDGLIKLRVQCLLTLQPIDFFAEIHHIGFHLFIGGNVLGGKEPVSAALAVQKGFSGIPGFGSFLTQF
jgi:hypothetical protein